MASAAIPCDSSRGATRHVHWEWQYLDLMRRIWEHGDERIDRTGIGTRSVLGAQIRFDLSGGAVPLVTTLPMAMTPDRIDALLKELT